MSRSQEGGHNVEHEGQATVVALFESTRATLIEHGVAHGNATVVNLPDGTWVIIARPAVEAPSAAPEARDDVDMDTGGTPAPPHPGPFQPGGGGFGGGGASGSW